MKEKGTGGACPHCGVAQLDPDPFGRSLPPGTLIGGKYLLGRVLGQGGFGITYLAWDEKLQRKLAIKEYLPRDFATRGTDGLTVVPYAGEEEKNFDRGRKKFLAEGQVLVKFQHHPGIVSSFDYLEANDTAYLVMEYLEGQTFESFLGDAGGLLAPQPATMVMLQVMDALRALHGEGLVHRDVSPDNIYITNTNQVKLLDFGSARHALRHSLSVDVIIKRGYSPVEQYQERGKIGPWTDVYATAATLYRALTGEAPPDSIERLADDRLVAPSSRGIALPAEAEQVLLEALAVDPAYRLRTIEELQQPLLALGGVVVEEPIPGPAQPLSSTGGAPAAESATERVVSLPVSPSNVGASSEDATQRVESQSMPKPVTEEVVTGRPSGGNWPPIPGSQQVSPLGVGIPGIRGLPGARKRQIQWLAAIVAVLAVLGGIWATTNGSEDEEPSKGALVVVLDQAAYATVDGFQTPDGGQSRSRRHRFSGLVPGSRRLKVWLDGYEEVRRQVYIDAGEELQISIELERRQ